VRTVRTLSFTPTNGARINRIRPWNIACVVPPSALPIATAERSMGATRTSFKKPNSRSQTMDIAPKMEVKRIAIPMMPGYMNWMYDSPPAVPKLALPLRDELKPEPNTSRKRRGCASEAATRHRSRQNRRMSRYQMM